MAQIETEKRRGAILRHLNDTAGYTLNAMILLDGCRAQGIPSTRDQLENAMRWLKDQELIEIVTERPLIAKLLVDGQEVATGVRVITGVTRPGPED